MNTKTKLLSCLLVLTLLVGTISVFSVTADTESAGPGQLSFNLRAVNLLSGEDTVDSSSELTIQYTDASLNNEDADIKMYVSIAKTDGTVLVEKQQVDTASLDVQNLEVQREGEYGGTGTMPVYSNMAGSVTLHPDLDATYSVSELTVTVWIEGAAKYSNRATTTINNGFTDGTPDGLTGSNWMNYIDGATLLSQINMPGAHDAATQYIPTVILVGAINQCQNQNIGTLLTYGVRYLDIRGDIGRYSTTAEVNGVQVQDFGIYHGTYAARKNSNSGPNLTFFDVYNWCAEFLDENPSETIFLTINNENGSDRSGLMSALQQFINADPNRFYTKTNEIPTLDDVRGKIVLVRRFPSGFGGAPNYAGDNGGMDFFWDDKVEGTLQAMVPVSSNLEKAVTTYRVQDNYGLSATNKSTTALGFLRTAENEKQANQYYINFFSTAPTLTTPSSSSTTINRNFNSSNEMEKGLQYGYLIFDFITAQIAETVYHTNIFTTEPQTQENNNESNDKIVLHYDFADIENGKVTDLTGNGFDGTLVNTGSLTVDGDYNTLTFNNAGKHGDGAGYVSIPQSVFRGTGDTATIQVWLKENGSPARNTWFSIGRNSNGIGNNFLVANTKWNDNGNGPRFAVKTTKVGGDGRELITTAPNAISPNAWHLLTYVLDGDTIRIYVDDGADPVVTGAVNANFSDMTGSLVDSPVRLGAASYWLDDDSFEGTMGDFAIYNYAVDTDEIAKKYEELSAAPYLTDIAFDSDGVLECEIDEETLSVYLKVAYNFDLANTTAALSFDGMKVLFAADGNNFQDVSEGGVLNLSGTNPTFKVISAGGSEKIYKFDIEQEDPPATPTPEGPTETPTPEEPTETPTPTEPGQTEEPQGPTETQKPQQTESPSVDQGPGKTETGDVAIPVVVLVLLGVAAVGMVVLKKKSTH